MKKKLTTITLCLFLYIGMFLVLLYFTNKDEQELPDAIAGVFDVSSTNIEEAGPFPLKGTWEFYPNQLFTPIDFVQAHGEPTPSFTYVPHMWSTDQDASLDHFGKATYRLQVNIQNDEQLYGLKTNAIRMSNKIYVNGAQVGQSGSPDEDKWQYTPENTPYVTYFPLQKGMNEIVVQVANYHYMVGGGIASPIYFGTDAQISQLRDHSLMHDFVLITALFIMGLYLLGLYFQRKDDHSLILLSIYCFGYGLFSSLHGEKVIYFIFPDIPYDLLLKMQYSSALVGYIALYFYLYHAFQSLISKSFVYFGAIIGMIYLLYQVAFPTYIPIEIHIFNFIYVLCTSIYFTYVFILAALEKEEGTWFLIIAVTMMSMYTMIQMFNMYGKVMGSYFPIEVIIFVLMLALLLSLRFSNAFKKVDSLSKELIKADQFKDEFLAKTSHEFKTPLHAIQNISQVMIHESQDRLTPDQKDNLSLMSGIAKRLSRLVNDILDLEKIKQGEMKVTPVAVDVDSTVSLLIKMFSFQSKEQGIQMIKQIPNDLPYVYADEVRFRQMISNLIDNALKYTERGQVTLAAVVRDGMVEVSVTDTGIGMTKEQLSNIFSPFQQFHDEEGAGLGLSIVQQLANLQGGRIEVTSVEGQGSTFTCILPMTKEQPVSPLQTAAVDEDDGREMLFKTPYISKLTGRFTILVVDDRFANLKVLIDLLESEQYKVIAVKSGVEALEIVQEIKVDLIILDLMMSGMSGYDVCTHVRRQYKSIELPILMVTASHHTEEKLASFQAGANDFLPKPFDVSEILARVENLLMMKYSAQIAIDFEVAFLQSQIKPHFLFNVFNTISSLSYTDIDKARDVIAYLADYLRGSFQFANTDQLIPFEKEMVLVQAYIEIEKARFQRKIAFVKDIPEGFSLDIPPLMIQPLVENAIRHGILKQAEGGIVTLSIVEDNGHVQIVIEDNGAGMSKEKLQALLQGEHCGESVGLKNIQQRMGHIIGGAIMIKSEPGVGTIVTLTFPKRRNRGNNTD
ncbi:response regulator [Bacillaceae bacterium SIJ1]|uniref:ATP-binding protein n=1 Tax=Litoribacterium kuwaitense TaxID=1398745 RepID=UPI0013EA6280|nr:ATP-binding protein [Litoribacterium kuwaitense]NGP45081.1 response regulator [Litoribacterium kuwaitense]